MIKVIYPEPEFRMKKENDRQYIFDSQRKNWLILTPEEWVRQNFIAYLLKVLHYPSSLIAVEKEIILNGLKKRFDVLVYDENHKPWMMVECKAPGVELSEKVLQQLLVYNQSVPVHFFVITNGKSTLGWKREGDGVKLMMELPTWQHSTQ
jgi:hypothetical protein